ncbi:hypothetical protein [Halegenticoccus soli]|uniref:hypothetical protein n=1 Tax=Halegenticoccus soli TaxID=1985678 RepID=UPI000C6DB290|nr:hypothetical protein [Halegenticoccus soli]
MSRSIVRPELAVRRVESVPSGSRVRHFDELSDAAQDRVLAAAEGEATDAGPLPADLRENEVIVFTRLYRVTGR